MIARGLYQHFRGDLYWVEGVAVDASNKDPRKDPMVVYRGLGQGLGADRTFVRPLSEFTGMIDLSPNHQVPRFRYVHDVAEIVPHPRPTAQEYLDGR